MIRRIVLLMAGLLGCSCEGGEVREGRCGPESAVVTRAVDGDTLELSSGERIRYLLVDTPEISGGKAECFGAEARLYNARLTEGREVKLDYDAECRDRFGRLLAYASVQDRSINALMIERGYGCVLFIPPAGASRESEFELLEARAKEERRGIWGACAETPCSKVR